LKCDIIGRGAENAVLENARKKDMASAEQKKKRNRSDNLNNEKK